MKLRPVDSEMLRLVGYDPRRHILEVMFNSGDRYQYQGVPPSKYEELMKAGSIGQYMHKNIIGRYDYKRIS
jgi:3-hydroxyacyl-CoA dehydrogenase